VRAVNAHVQVNSDSLGFLNQGLSLPGPRARRSGRRL